MNILRLIGQNALIGKDVPPAPCAYGQKIYPSQLSDQCHRVNSHRRQPHAQQLNPAWAGASHGEHDPSTPTWTLSGYTETVGRRLGFFDHTGLTCQAFGPVWPRFGPAWSKYPSEPISRKKYRRFNNRVNSRCRHPIPPVRRLQCGTCRRSAGAWCSSSPRDGGNRTT